MKIQAGQFVTFIYKGKRVFGTVGWSAKGYALITGIKHSISARYIWTLSMKVKARKLTPITILN